MFTRNPHSLIKSSYMLLRKHTQARYEVFLSILPSSFMMVPNLTFKSNKMFPTSSSFTLSPFCRRPLLDLKSMVKHSLFAQITFYLMFYNANMLFVAHFILLNNFFCWQNFHCNH